MQEQVVSILRGTLLEICVDTAFLVIGLASCAIAALRRRSGVHVFLWTGIWSAAYGLMHLLQLDPVQAALAPALRPAAQYAITILMYSMLVAGAYAWLDLLAGALRRFISVVAIVAIITAVVGIGWFVATGDSTRFMRLNNMIAALILACLLITVLHKRLFEKYLVLPNRGFLIFGTAVFSLEALFQNVARPLFNVGLPTIVDHLGFFLLLAALAHSGLTLVQKNEHQLLEIQAELDVARQIQSSILPKSVPEVNGLRVAATYRPMASVAGDFYEFIPVDRYRAGFLVADVCGHGVPAALIASMLKVAVQSVANCAQNPGKFLGELNRVLAEPLNGQLVSAAYLWVDMHERKATYSAAGHPPLIRFNGKFERIESNGLLFGIMPNVAYPVRSIELGAGDRLLLYTDGLTEPENNAGQPFGDGQLELALTNHRDEAPEGISGKIVSAIEKWQRTPEPQDDVTLVVIDVV